MLQRRQEDVLGRKQENLESGSNQCALRDGWVRRVCHGVRRPRREYNEW